jgi:hypothetical protein
MHQHLGHDFEVAVEEGDRPVASWVCPRLATPLVDKGDQAQPLRLRQSQPWLLEAVVKGCHKVVPNHVPHGCVELVGEPITARSLAPRQACQGCLRLPARERACLSFPAALLLLLVIKFFIYGC